MAYSVSIAPLVINSFIGSEATFTATTSGAAAAGTETFVWTVDGQPQASVTGTLTITASGVGSKVVKVVATNTPTEGAPETAEGTASLVVEVRPPSGVDDLPYVHPLPFRGSAYIWCGWWVMDEIQSMTNESKDWKTDSSGLYWEHRYVLQQMLADYPEVDVQESRNGRIIHRSALDVGIIYDYVY
jgi:hypothetical protein